MTKPFYQWTGQEILEYYKKLPIKTRIRLVASAVGGLIFLILVAWPAWVSRLQEKSQVESLSIQIQMAQAQINQEPALLKQRKEQEDFIRQTHERILREGEGEKVVGILASIAEQSHVTLLGTEPTQEFQPGEEEGLPAPFNKRYRRTSYIVSLEGGYHPLAEYVSRLEDHQKIFRIDELSIVPKEENVKIHTAQVLVSAFALVEGKAGQKKGEA